MNATSKRNVLVASALIVSAFSFVPVYAMSLSSSRFSGASRASYTPSETPQDGSIVINAVRRSKPLP